jgi:hypothetical protein
MLTAFAKWRHLQRELLAPSGTERKLNLNTDDVPQGVVWSPSKPRSCTPETSIVRKAPRCAAGTTFSHTESSVSRLTTSSPVGRESGAHLVRGQHIENRTRLCVPQTCNVTSSLLAPSAILGATVHRAASLHSIQKHFISPRRVLKRHKPTMKTDRRTQLPGGDDS